jgi:hypothetical protein
VDYPAGAGPKPIAYFPTETLIQPLRLPVTRASQSCARPETSGPARVPRLPLSVNPLTATLSRPPPVQYENPWETYKSIRLVERGSVVTLACAHLDQANMVTVKRLSSSFIKELAACRYENLMSALELYKFKG